MIEAHLHALQREHHNLEEAIRTQYAAHNDDMVHRLKIEKMHIKEEIERLREETAG